MNVTNFALISESPLVLEWIQDNPPLPAGRTTGFDPLVWSTTMIAVGGQQVVGLVDASGGHLNASVLFAPPPSNIQSPYMLRLTERLAQIRASSNGDPQKLLPGMTGYQEFNIFAAADQQSSDQFKPIIDRLDRIIAKLGA